MTKKTQPIQTGSYGEVTKTSATTDTPAHTPLPWATGKGIAFACSIYSGTTSLAFARQDHGRIDATTAEANAAFIVRACNSHHLLTEALRGIIDHFDCSHGNAPGHDHLIPGVWDKDVSNGAKGGTKCGWCEQWNEARAALSQAGGHNAD